MADPRQFIDALLAHECGLFCGVPDSLLRDFCACALDAVPKEQNIICANEGNAVGIACGYHMATGRFAAVYMQNSGEGNAVNPLLSIADPDVYSIPMLLIIGWRGEPGVHDEPQHVKQGKVTLSLLDAMDIPYRVMDESWQEQLSTLCKTMRDESRPVALVVRKGGFEPYPNKGIAADAELSRERMLEAILGSIDEKDLVVSTTGKESREVFEIRERWGKGHERDFLAVGGMGHTASIAFGLALGSPERLVWCLDGDGSMLMHLGSLPVMASRWPRNLRYIVNVNGAHESVGGQPTVARDFDVAAALEALGLGEVVVACTEAEVETGVHKLSAAEAHAMAVYTRPGSRDDLGRPTTSPKENKAALMRELGSLRSDVQ